MVADPVPKPVLAGAVPNPENAGAEVVVDVVPNPAKPLAGADPIFPNKFGADVVAVELANPPKPPSVGTVAFVPKPL